MTIPTAFRAFRIRSDGKRHDAAIESLGVDDLSAGEVVIKTAFSSINYKDALAGTGKGKIARQFPINGGIDVAGHVVQSADPRFREGDAVLVTGCGLSETRDGGYSDYARLEARWVVPLPSGLSLREAMILGTAGFTAALALYRMQQNGQTPELGPILVSGATGGVGMLAIDLFTRAGYSVHAISGKPEHFGFLASLGATQCISRQDLWWGQRPLETASWGGAVDNVGGDMLAGLTRSVKPNGSIACCGMAGSAELHTTVMPFIIRGVSLLGVASAGTAYPVRQLLWQHLASDWKPANLDRIASAEVDLDGMPAVFERMLAGGSFGRTVVRF